MQLRNVKRAQEPAKSCKEEDNRWHVNVYKYASKEECQLGVDDMTANKTLSLFTIKLLYYPTSKRAIFLQFQRNHFDNYKYISVWSTGEIKWPSNITILRNNMNCNCQFKIDYNVQCEREVHGNAEFIIDIYASKWLHPHICFGEVPSIISNTFVSEY